MRGLSLVVALVATAVLPAAAQARDVTQTAQSGDVSATLTYRIARDVYSNVRLQITRAGSVFVNGRLGEVSCGRNCASWAPGLFAVPGPVVVKANARTAFTLFTRSKRRHDDIAARAVLAAWTADRCVLGRSTQAFARLEAARTAGDLGTARAGARYIAQLRTFLRRGGYL